MYAIVTIVVLVVVFAFVFVWTMRARRRKRPEPGPTIPDLSIATEIQRLEQLRDEGTISEVEFREAKSRLLS